MRRPCRWRLKEGDLKFLTSATELSLPEHKSQHHEKQENGGYEQEKRSSRHLPLSLLRELASRKLPALGASKRSQRSIEETPHYPPYPNDPAGSSLDRSAAPWARVRHAFPPFLARLPSARATPAPFLARSRGTVHFSSQSNHLRQRRPTPQVQRGATASWHLADQSQGLSLGFRSSDRGSIDLAPAQLSVAAPLLSLHDRSHGGGSPAGQRA